MKGKRVIGVLLVVVGVVFILNSLSGVTGFAVLEDVIGQVGDTWSLVGGLVLVVGGVLVFASGREEEEEGEEKESELVDILDKLFVRDKRTGMIKMIDPVGAIFNEIKYPSVSKSAQTVLDDMENCVNGDKDFKEVVSSEMDDAGYIRAAYLQRDASRSLEPMTPPFFADLFLKKFDPKYRGFVPPTNELLIYDESQISNQLLDKEVYDTRKVIPIMAENIPDFKLELMSNHDPAVSYKGAKFNMMAGSKKPYEIPKKNIVRALNRIMREDLKKRRINESEKEERLSVLKRIMFG